MQENIDGKLTHMFQTLADQARAVRIDFHKFGKDLMKPKSDSSLETIRLMATFPMTMGASVISAAGYNNELIFRALASASKRLRLP